MADYPPSSGVHFTSYAWNYQADAVWPRCHVCGESKPSRHYQETGGGRDVLWCRPCSNIRDRLPWGASERETREWAERLVQSDRAAARAEGRKPYYGWRRINAVIPHVMRLHYDGWQTYVLYRWENGAAQIEASYQDHGSAVRRQQAITSANPDRDVNVQVADREGLRRNGLG